jgi:hypothetical protein
MTKLKRPIEALIVGAVIVTIVAMVLSAAYAWGNEGHCIRQFPKLIGCVLATHEELAGGLIGAGGALFAAWWAASYIREQIAIERQKLASSDRERRIEQARRIETDRNELARQINALTQARSEAARVVALFAGLDKGRADSFIGPLLRSRVAGELYVRIISNDLLGLEVVDCVNAMNSIATALRDQHLGAETRGDLAKATQRRVQDLEDLARVIAEQLDSIGRQQRELEEQIGRLRK